MMNSAQPISFDPIGPDELDMTGKAFQDDELQRRALSRNSEDAEALPQS